MAQSEDPTAQDPEGQPSANDPDRPADASPTDEIEINGVKIPFAEIEKHERMKDYFDAYNNREKWQRENTKKAQEIAEVRHKADLYDQVIAERSTSLPENEYERKKQDYVEKKTKLFPEVDPRFFESQFDDLNEWTSRQAEEKLVPFYQDQGERFEAEFLTRHPDVKKYSEEYYEIAKRMERGYDPEEAYAIVFRGKLRKEEIDSAVKVREEEAKRKLQQSRTQSMSGTRPKPRTYNESFEEAWSKYGGG